MPEQYYTIHHSNSGDTTNYHLIVCSGCAWFRYSTNLFNGAGWCGTEAVATLQKHELHSAEIPIAILEKYLDSHWDDRRLISAEQAEDIVSHIFAEHMDCKIHYVSNGVFALDGGIDFVLAETRTGVQHAFQVKRRLTDAPERVQRVREFVGAVATSRFNNGFYVTFAPRFTKTAQREVDAGRDNLREHNINLTLIDGTRLKEILNNRKHLYVQLHPLKIYTQSEPYCPTDGWVKTKLGTDCSYSLKKGKEVTINEIIEAHQNGCSPM